MDIDSSLKNIFFRSPQMVLESLDTGKDSPYLERRSERRLIKRMNWGKTLSIRSEFLSECQIANQTSKGACLRIARRVHIPRFFLLYNDNSGVILEAEVIWRRGMDLGCQFAGKPNKSRAELARRMCARYYGIR